MKEQSLRRQAAVTAGGNAAVRMLGFGMRLAVTRLLGAEAVGVMELAASAHMAALTAADEVIIPVELEGFALDGARDLCEQVESLRRLNPRLRVAGALITKRYRSKLQDEAEAALRATSIPVFLQTIPRRAVVPESTVAGVALRDYFPGSPAALSYQLFAQEFLEQEGENNG